MRATYASRRRADGGARCAYGGARTAEPGTGPIGPGPAAVIGSHWARKGVQSLRHVVSREVEAVGEELGERLGVLLPALLGARAHLAECLAQIGSVDAQGGGEPAHRPRVVPVAGAAVGTRLE